MYIKDTLKASISGNSATATTLQTARNINGTSFNGSESITTANWGTARTLTVGSTGKSVNGSANITWTLDEIGAAPKSHDHNRIVTRDNVTCESGITARPAVSGLSMTQAYNNGYPYNYGNVISLRGQGDGQIFVGWSGTDGAHAPTYIRSKRDNTTTADWSPWAKVYTEAFKPTPSEIGALPISGGAMTGAIGFSSGAMSGSWVGAANGASMINSQRDAGGFSPIASGATTNGKMVLAMYQGGIKLAYLTKENCDSGTNTVSSYCDLFNEDGTTALANDLTVNGSGNIHNINRINFRAHADDGAWIKSTVDGSVTMMDFFISDDAGQDRFRWIGNLYNSSDGSHPDRVAMELYPHLNGAELYLNGSLLNSGNLYMTANGASIYGKATDGGNRKMLCLTGGNVTDVGNTSGTTCLLGSGNAHPTHYDGSNTYTLHSDKNHSWGYFRTNGGQDFLGRDKRCIVATETDLVLNYGPDFTRILTHGSMRVNGDSSVGGVGYHDSYITINGYNVSVQSNAPGVGGVWIQV